MNQESEMWDWRFNEYGFDDNTTIDISGSLLDGAGPTEDFCCIFDDGTTPVKACRDLACHANGSENMNKDLDQSNDGSLQLKRRRMLQFGSEELGETFCLEGMSSTFLRSHETPVSFEGPLLEMEQWVSGFSGGASAFDGDIVVPSSEGWNADCFVDTEMNFCSENVNSSVASDVQIDITDLCDTSPTYENNVVQAQPVHTCQNVLFKGRKSYMRTPTKISSSVVSPFAIIKPCSVDGDVTLKDINQRLRDPASKLKQKKEELSRAFPKSAFSGKPVVGKTKIQTEGGRGSITIMRTKG